MPVIKVPMRTSRIVRQTIVAKERPHVGMPTIGRAGGQMGKLLAAKLYLWLGMPKGHLPWPSTVECVDKSYIILAVTSRPSK